MGHLSSKRGTFVRTFWVHLSAICRNICHNRLYGNGDNQASGLRKNQSEKGKEPHKIRALSVCIHFVSILYTDLYTFRIHSIV